MTHMASVNLLIAIHYQILRDGLKTILKNESDLAIRDSINSREELFASGELGNTDLLLLDLDMPEMDPVDGVNRLCKEYPDLKILALSDREDAGLTKSVMQAGASGYLLKKRGSDELLQAIREVNDGHHYVCDDTLRLLIDRDAGKSGHSEEPGVLTERELQVLELICNEMTNKEIAKELSISVRTVDAHRRNLLQKTGARNTAGLVTYAIKNGIFQP